MTLQNNKKRAEAYRRLQEKFLAFEEREKLFDLVVDGCRVWEHIRVQVNRIILRRADVFEQRTAEERISFSKLVARATNWLSVFARSLPRNGLSCDWLFVCHPRRVLSKEGVWRDIYTYPLVKALGSRALTFEETARDGHRRPAGTERLIYEDLLIPVYWLLRVLRPTFLRGEIAQKLSRCENAGIEEFGSALPFLRLALKAARRDKARRTVFGWLLYVCKPKALVVVVSYGKESLVKAARQKGIPTYELQHGAISHFHMGYHFPGTPKSSYPDFLLSFGSFWTRMSSFSVKEGGVLAMGFPFLEEAVSQKSEKKDGSVLFISQETIGSELSRFALRARQLVGSATKFVYKLHPAEAASSAGYSVLLASKDGFDVISGQQPPLFELLARASFVVGVYSTAIYEALAFGCRVALVNLPGKQFMHDLIELGHAEVVDSPSDLAKFIQLGANTPAPPLADDLFRPAGLDRMVALFRTLADDNQEKATGSITGDR